MDWQTILALAIVGVAAIFLVQLVVQRAIGKSSSCGSCSNCKSDSSPLVQLQLPLRKTDRD